MFTAIRCQMCDTSLRQRNTIEGRPLCGVCLKNLVEFVETRDPTLFVGFQVLMLKNLANHGLSERIKAALSKAKENGVRLGRPQIHDYDAIKALRSQGMSYRQIQRQLGTPAATISKIMKAAKQRDAVSARG